jgi:hypothetical protein
LVMDRMVSLAAVKLVCAEVDGEDAHPAIETYLSESEYLSK